MRRERASALFATSAKKTQSLDAAAQFAAILDEVIAPIIRIDLLKFHCLVTDHTIHQIQERASVVVHRPEISLVHSPSAPSAIACSSRHSAD
jgi:hypothetical protein